MRPWLRVASCAGAIVAALLSSQCAPRPAPRAQALFVARFDYWRFPSPQAWPAALAPIHRLGYNAVALDFYWGYHSPRPGVYDFSGSRDVDRLLADAARAGLDVVPQTGPYIGADAEAGGLPDWMLARGRDPAAMHARYLRESRQWLRRIDAILARHRLGAGGTVVPPQAGPFPVAVAGVDWGWTGDPQRFAGPYEGAPPNARGARSALLTPVSGWRTQRDDAQAARLFDDQAWPPLLRGYPVDSDDARAPVLATHAARPTEFLGADEYGFHRGVVWYRGHFVASGSERAFRLRGVSGRGGALTVWLNGVALGSALAGPEGRIDATLPIAARALRARRSNVLAVLFEITGHGEGADRDLRRTQPRGMLAASLLGARDVVRWQILGNGEYNADPVRGPANSGGLGGEIAGWQMPEFRDGAWGPATLPVRAARAGVVWYRARVDLGAPRPAGLVPALQIDDPQPSRHRAFLFVNGWLIGRYAGGSGPHLFPIPPGIAGDGDAAIAIAVWNLRAGSGLGRVWLTEADGFPDPHEPLAQPPEVRARNGVARLRLDVATEGNDPRPHFVYRGRAVAPTIRVRPGDAIEIEIHNGLPPSAQTANAIDLHFHGLNVAPVKPGDDVLTTLARPGQTLRYRVVVPRSQPPGLYWYHPHSHGETYWQVTSGMAGAIVVEGLARRLPALAAMRERIIIVRDVQDAPDILAIPWYARRMTPRYAGFDDESGTNRPCLPESALHLTVDGEVEPAIAIEPGERELFRVLNASASRVLDLAIDGERLGLVAFDGYPVGEAAGNPPILWSDRVVVAPGARAEFVATGLERPTVLRTRCYDSGPGGDRDPAAVLAVLERGAPPATSQAASASGRRAAVRSTIPAGSPAVRRTVTLSENADGFAIDGRLFHMGDPPLIIARAGTLEEWTIVNRSNEVHALHIHQVHFLVESLDGAPAHPRLWRDTVLVRKRATILVDFRSPLVRGRFVMHCHMLDHEDGGMMAVIEVV